MTEKSFVTTQLENAAAIYQQRYELYGDNYKRFGPLMAALFPDGLTLKTADDFGRMGVFVQVVSKITRYGNMFTAGGHPDSLDDTSVYAQMLQELDHEAVARANAAGHTFPDHAVQPTKPAIFDDAELAKFQAEMPEGDPLNQAEIATDTPATEPPQVLS